MDADSTMSSNGSASDAGPADCCCVSPGFDGIFERTQGYISAVTVLESPTEQQVGKPGVLWQQRPVQIGADHMVQDRSFVAAFAVVAMTTHHSAEWHTTGA